MAEIDTSDKDVKTAPTKNGDEESDDEKEEEKEQEEEDEQEKEEEEEEQEEEDEQEKEEEEEIIYQDRFYYVNDPQINEEENLEFDNSEWLSMIEEINKKKWNVLSWLRIGIGTESLQKELGMDLSKIINEWLLMVCAPTNSYLYRVKFYNLGDNNSLRLIYEKWLEYTEKVKEDENVIGYSRMFHIVTDKAIKFPNKREYSETKNVEPSYPLLASIIQFLSENPQKIHEYLKSPFSNENWQKNLEAIFAEKVGFIPKPAILQTIRLFQLKQIYEYIFITILTSFSLQYRDTYKPNIKEKLQKYIDKEKLVFDSWIKNYGTGLASNNNENMDEKTNKFINEGISDFFYLLKMHCKILIYYCLFYQTATIDTDLLSMTLYKDISFSKASFWNVPSFSVYVPSIDVFQKRTIPDQMSRLFRLFPRLLFTGKYLMYGFDGIIQHYYDRTMFLLVMASKYAFSLKPFKKDFMTHFKISENEIPTIDEFFDLFLPKSSAMLRTLKTDIDQFLASQPTNDKFYSNDLMAFDFLQCFTETLTDTIDLELNQDEADRIEFQLNLKGIFHAFLFRLACFTEEPK